MSTIDSIVAVNISITSGGVTGPDLGTTLCLASLPAAVDTKWGTERVRTYTSAADMLTVAEGFAATDSAYRMVSNAFSQNPKPARVKVGRRASKPTQIVHLTPTSTTAGDVYSWTCSNKTITYTVLVADDTVAKVCAKLVTAATAAGPTGITTTDGTTHIIGTSTAGTVYEYSAISSNLQFSDESISPTGLAADISACELADPNWYFLVSDAFGRLEIAATAAVVETMRKMYVWQSADFACTGSGTTHIGYTEKAAARFRSSGWWHQDATLKASDVPGNRSTVQPGTDTWWGKTLVGWTPSTALTATQIQNLQATNLNYVLAVGSVNRTFGGLVSGGEYADNVRGIDALRAAMQIAVYTEMVSVSKLPNTSYGRSRIKGAIETTLMAYTATPSQPHLLSPDVAQIITVPPVSDSTSFSAVTRALSGITWSAGLANAIQAATVTGTLSE
jgi:hypothetical protein